jgi:hypothetical protein
VFIAISAPIVAYLQTANAVTSLAADSLPPVVVEITDGAYKNPAAKTVKILGGDLLVNTMTRTKVGGEVVKLEKEIAYVSSLGDVISVLSSDEINKENAAKVLSESADAFDRSTLVPTLASEFVSEASHDWSRQKPFCGIDAPDLGADLEPAMISLYKALDGSTKESIREDYRTVVNSLVIIANNDALGALKEDGDTISLFKNEEMVAGIILEMFNNERLSTTI